MFPEVSKPETLEKRYVGKLSKKALSLMNGLLKMDPSDRLTALEALAHPYFDALRETDQELKANTELAEQIAFLRKQSEASPSKNLSIARSAQERDSAHAKERPQKRKNAA